MNRVLLTVGIVSGGLAVAGVGSSGNAQAAELHVDPTPANGGCSDSQRGRPPNSRVQPFCSIGPALRAAQGGDYVYVAPGDYGNVRLRGVEFRRDVTLNGASGRMGSNQATLRGLDVTSSRRLRVTGFRFTGRVRIRSGRSLRMRFNTFRSGSVRVTGSQDITIADNTFATPPRSEAAVACSPNCAPAVDVTDSSGLSIRTNRFNDLSVDAISLWRVRRARIERNEITGSRQDSAARTVGAVRLITPTRDVRVKGNEVTGVRGIGAYLSESTPAAHIGLEIVNNLLVVTDDWAMNLHASPGVRVINNTAWEGQSDVILARDGTYRDRTHSAIVLNNIFERLNAPIDSTLLEDHNLIASGDRRGAHDIAEAPTFYHPPGACVLCHFTLLDDSAGIDAGTSEPFAVDVRIHNGAAASRTYRYVASAPQRDIHDKRRHDLARPDTGSGPVPFIDIGAHETGSQ